MKTPSFLRCLAVVLLGTSGLSHADSKRTAEYLLSSPTQHEGQSVTVDVAVVQPVRFKSPFPELAFFHAMTIDRSDRKPGGVIMVAVPAEDGPKFAKKYGTDFEGRNDSDQLKGTLVASGPRRIYVIDTSGQLQKLQEERKQALPDDALMNGPVGPKGPRGGPGPRKGL
jgi:hypothetical protein